MLLPEDPDDPELPFPEEEPVEALYLFVLSLELLFEFLELVAFELESSALLELDRFVLFELDRFALFELAALEFSSSGFKEFELLAVALLEFERVLLFEALPAKAPVVEPVVFASAVWVVPGRSPRPKRSGLLLKGFIVGADPVVFGSPVAGF